MHSKNVKNVKVKKIDYKGKLYSRVRISSDEVFSKILKKP
jgi:hypothetical protein